VIKVIGDTVVVKPECQGIEDELQVARDRLTAAQQDFLEAAPNSAEKAAAKKRAKEALDLVYGLERQQRDCEGLPQYPDPVRALFTCTVSFSTNTSVLPFGVTQNVPASMVLWNIDYRQVEFSFPSTDVAAVVVGAPPLAVTNVVSAKTVSTVTGVYERSTGHIDMASARFEVKQSVNVFDNGTAEFNPLTTRTAMSPTAPGGMLMGRPLDRSGVPGRVVLVGSTVLSSGGCFNGVSVDMIIDGVLSAFPPA
jgi:hypothetical protein